MKTYLCFFALALPALTVAVRGDAPETGPQLGLQTYTCRNMTFDEVMDFAVAHHFKYLELAGKHLDPSAPKEEALRRKAQLAARGLVAYSFGVAATSRDKEANRKLFEFARLMDMKFIVVEPKVMAEWDNLEDLVKEYDIKLAIHNHGTGTAYGDPVTVKKVLAARDRRIGVCLDIGWVSAAGFDVAAVFRDYGDRVFDMHIKDKIVETIDGKRVATDVEIGKGNANFNGLFTAMKKVGWTGVMAIEVDRPAFAADPHPFVTAARAFFEKHVPAK